MRDDGKLENVIEFFLFYRNLIWQACCIHIYIGTNNASRVANISFYASGYGIS